MEGSVIYIHSLIISIKLINRGGNAPVHFPGFTQGARLVLSLGGDAPVVFGMYRLIQSIMRLISLLSSVDKPPPLLIIFNKTFPSQRRLSL